MAKPARAPKARKLAEGQVRYDCTENDNHLILSLNDGELDEIQVGDVLEKSWTVIGYNDLRRALQSVGYDAGTR